MGRTSLIWLDANRSKRPVKLDIWYRADPSGNLAGRYFPNLDALWTDKTTAGAISDRFGPALPGITQGTFFSNACDNARKAKSGSPFLSSFFHMVWAILPTTIRFNSKTSPVMATLWPPRNISRLLRSGHAGWKGGRF